MPPSRDAPSDEAAALAAGAYARDRERTELALEAVRRAICSLGAQIEMCLEGVQATESRVLVLEAGVTRLSDRVEHVLRYVPFDAERFLDEAFAPESGSEV